MVSLLFEGDDHDDNSDAELEEYTAGEMLLNTWSRRIRPYESCALLLYAPVCCILLLFEAMDGLPLYIRLPSSSYCTVTSWWREVIVSNVLLAHLSGAFACGSGLLPPVGLRSL